jgi:hypothetical protein
MEAGWKRRKFFLPEGFESISRLRRDELSSLNQKFKWVPNQQKRLSENPDMLTSAGISSLGI